MMEHNQSIQMYMTIRAQRDAAMQERNMALEERKRAFAERDMAMLQRDAAIAECNSAIQERDEAIAALRLQENSMNDIKMSLDSPGNEMVHGSKHIDDQQQLRHIPHLSEAVYSPWEIPKSEPFQLTEVASETSKPRKERQPKQSKTTKSSKSPGVSKRGAEDLSKQITPKLNGLKNEQDMGSDEEDLDRQLVVWKDNSGLNQITFDESAMPVPVCSCTGLPQPCYRWGNGGWQSACCTTTMSMYPLPQVSDKRYSRVGGRKMSGSAFTKLLNRLAAEGHDLFTPLDLKDHWAKHGTNRYSTPK